MLIFLSISRLRQLSEPLPEVLVGNETVKLVMDYPMDPEGVTKGPTRLEITGQRRGENAVFDTERTEFRAFENDRRVQPGDEAFDAYRDEARMFVEAIHDH